MDHGCAKGLGRSYESACPAPQTLCRSSLTQTGHPRDMFARLVSSPGKSLVMCEQLGAAPVTIQEVARSARGRVLSASSPATSWCAFPASFGVPDTLKRGDFK